jgi:hypothetical protein
MSVETILRLARSAADSVENSGTLWKSCLLDAEGVRGSNPLPPTTKPQVSNLFWPAVHRVGLFYRAAIARPKLCGPNRPARPGLR